MTKEEKRNIIIHDVFYYLESAGYDFLHLSKALDTCQYNRLLTSYTVRRSFDFIRVDIKLTERMINPYEEPGYTFTRQNFDRYDQLIINIYD